MTHLNGNMGRVDDMNEWLILRSGSEMSLICAFTAGLSC
jgi:hypothetical protein